MKLIDSPYSLSLMQERRHTRRQKIDSVVYVNIGRDNGGVLLDLSEEGMCISVANPLTVSSEIRFELGLAAGKSIEGTAQVSWLSESGKSAGVRFSPLPNESRRLVRNWLDESIGSAKKAETATATGQATVAEQPSAKLLNGQSPAGTDTEPESASSHSSGSRDGLVMPQSPLFFFPKRPGADEVSDEQLSSQPEPYTWRAEHVGAENAAERVEAFRAAIVAQPEKVEETSPEERHFKKAAIVFTVCLALLAAGIAAVVAYPKRFAEIRQLTASLTGPSTVAPAAPAKSSRPTRRARRKVFKRPMFPVLGPQRGSRPVGYSGIFDAPNSGGAQSFVGASGGSQQIWSARTSSRRLVRRDGTSDSPATESTLSSSAEDEGGEASAPTQAGALRVEGGLVDEGSVSPTFAPLNLNGQALNSKPVIVEAVIGTNGAVKTVRLVSSPDSSLAQAVVSAVQQWRYRPFYSNGQPIEFVTRITVDFERHITPTR